MLAKRIIPCLDVDKGRVVKGVRFVNLKDAGDPVEAAKAYNDAGADEMVFLDITASHERRPIILDVVEKTAAVAFMPLTVGGGVRTVDDIRNLLNAGADKVAINTAALEDPEFIQQASERFGSQCIVVAIDAKRVKEPYIQVETNPAMGFEWRSRVDWEAHVFTHGGRVTTGLNAVTWAKKAEAFGAGEILLTSMDRDGTKQGYDIELTQVIAEYIGIPVIASGGAGKLEHFADVLTRGGADAALAASLFHFGELTIAQVKGYLATHGVAVRR